MPGEQRKTQEVKILEVLVSGRGGWVGAPELAAISLQYSARVHALRNKGFCIENQVQTGWDGIRRGYFRLVGGGSPAKMQSLNPPPVAPCSVQRSWRGVHRPPGIQNE